jgi:predicted MFS family arabinose efflux permease
MKSGHPTDRFISDFFSMLLVSGLSLFLLIYIGFGEAQRSYEQLQYEKLMAQGQIIQNAMEKVLRPGLPLKQYVGFNTLCERILASDESISVIIAYDRNQQPVFTSGDKFIPLLPTHHDLSEKAGLEDLADKYLQVQLPLSNRFEQIGSLALTIPKSTITQKIQTCFKPLLITGALLSLAFSVFIALFRPQLKKRKLPWLQISFAATFLMMSIVIVASIVALYSDGAQAKTRALADSLGYRLADIVSFNLIIDDIVGLDQLFADYQRLNPDIDAAALIINDKVAIHTDPQQVGQPWIRDKASYEYIVDLTPPGSIREIRTAVAMPFDIVYKRTLRSVKNFAALFVASAFLAGLFLQLASTLPGLYKTNASLKLEAKTPESEEALLNLVKPVFFVAVFIEHLTYSFLPQFIDQIVMQDNLSSNYLSLPFITYYLFFALALVPAGHMADKFSPQRLMYFGLVLSAAGLSMLALHADIITVILARSISGLGQGILFIGVQTYILMTVSPSKRTQGVSIIVFGFQGGMISGLTIGSLLVPYMGEQGVFLLCGAIGILMTFYTMSMVPAIRNVTSVESSLRSTMRELGRNMALVSRNLKFFKTMALVGIPAKMILTGVILFALPLLLSQKNYHQEDIGQIIMIYGACVLISTHYFSRWVDRMGRSHIVLFWGTMISGLGIVLIGMTDWEGLSRFTNDESLYTIILIIGVAITGLSHGMINAPVVTHIAQSTLAKNIGASTATATYRFMERIGHIAGPVLIGQLFVFGGQNASMLTWVGVIIMICALIFIIGAAQPRTLAFAESHSQ